MFTYWYGNTWFYNAVKKKKFVMEQCIVYAHCVKANPLHGYSHTNMT
jgi:hypothetical protein